MVIVIIQNGNNSSIIYIQYKSEVSARSTILIYNINIQYYFYYKTSRFEIVEYTGQFPSVFAPTYRGDKYGNKTKVYMPRWYSNRQFSEL